MGNEITLCDHVDNYYLCTKSILKSTNLWFGFDHPCQYAKYQWVGDVVCVWSKQALNEDVGSV